MTEPRDSTTAPAAVNTSHLAGRVALVTGGSRGIGAGIAKRLAADGANVVLTYTNAADRAAQVVDDITTRGGSAHALRADCARDEDVARSVNQTVTRFGALDVLVNNAGVGGLDQLHEVSLQDIDHMLAVNVRAMVLATRAALRVMGPGGRIINIGSVNADRMPIPGGSIYAMTKGAVAGFTRGMARELGPRQITINNVQPGPVDTDLNPATGNLSPHMLNAMAVDRFGDVSEVGALVSFLAGPEAGFITGASLTIDGGFAA